MEHRRIVHGDIKPENLTINNAGELTIINFGAAFHENTQDVCKVHTPDYAAPEIWINRNVNRTCKFDVWAGGIVFAEIFYEELPWYWMPNKLALMKKSVINFYTTDENFNKALQYAVAMDVRLRSHAFEILALLQK